MDIGTRGQGTRSNPARRLIYRPGVDAPRAAEDQLLLIADERLSAELATRRTRIGELEADNVHLRGLLRLSPAEVRRPEPGQTAIFEASPGPVTALSSPAAKVAFYAESFRSRIDVYAVRWDNERTARGGWMPAVAGGFRKGVRPSDRTYLPLTEPVLTKHLSGELEVGLYPLLDTTVPIGWRRTSTARPRW